MAHRRAPHQKLEDDLERLNNRQFDSLTGLVRTNNAGRAGRTMASGADGR
jgi:hypothetical protein